MSTEEKYTQATFYEYQIDPNTNKAVSTGRKFTIQCTPTGMEKTVSYAWRIRHVGTKVLKRWRFRKRETLRFIFRTRCTKEKLDEILSFVRRESIFLIKSEQAIAKMTKDGTLVPRDTRLFTSANVYYGTTTEDTIVNPESSTNYDYAEETSYVIINEVSATIVPLYEIEQVEDHKEYGIQYWDVRIICERVYKD